MISGQRPLSLDTAGSYHRHDLWEYDGNRAALQWIDQWPHVASRAALIVGPTGSGKTHLLKVWQQRAPQGLASDDLDHNLNNPFAILHDLNHAVERGTGWLATASQPPVTWTLNLPDLSSRLNALPVFTLTAPDQETLAAVMGKIFSDRQIFVEAPVIAFVISRIERSFASVREAAQQLDHAALVEKRPITIPLAKSALNLA